MSLVLPFSSDAGAAKKRPSWRARRFNARPLPQVSALPLLRIRTRELVESLEARGEYVSPDWKRDLLSERTCKRGRPQRDPRYGLPVLPEDTAATLARRYGASKERLYQGLALHSHGLHGKARRLVLCGRLGRAIDHQVERGSCDRKFFEQYFCREKYCTFCGPPTIPRVVWKIAKHLSPVAEKLICEGVRHDRRMVTAKIDFTTRNSTATPTDQDVREFHADMRRFWRLVERVLGIQRSEYGVVRCDEVGGNNTNLHAHSGYVGPRLNQECKELSALWSIASCRAETSSSIAETCSKAGHRYGLGPAITRGTAIRLDQISEELRGCTRPRFEISG